MCGIVGIVGAPPEDAGTLERMCGLLHHRGPNDRGVWRSPSAHIGHTRLSILDLSAAGHQPMVLGERVLTYNGEIYNFQELRRELPGPFLSESDSEVVLHAYREWGVACVERFHGMFAFAIWDEARGRLFAARDRLGIKPLYYRLLPDGLAFASEIQPLLELGRPELDRSALADYLTYGYVPAPRTAFQGILRLPPAHTLTLEADGRARLRRYWTLRVAPKQPAVATPAGFHEAAEAVRAGLDEAARLRMIADVPLGAFLSGGV
ncbi:MAG: asparagine synthetase B, partial [Acidobacteria bacterium]|nr:asparagine synthetase B [Acidobacteriota bacterium]